MVALVAVAGLVGLAVPALRTLGEFASGGRPADLGVNLPEAPPTGTREPSIATSPAEVLAGSALRCHAVQTCRRWRLPSTTDVAARVALVGGQLVVPTTTSLVSIRTSSGRQAWRTELSPAGRTEPSIAAVADHTTGAVVAATAGELAAISADDGTVRWRQSVPGLRGVQAAGALDDIWLVTADVEDTDGLRSFTAVLAMAGDSGEVRWRRDAANATVTAAGAVLQDVNGTLTGLARDGSDAWRLVTERPAASLSPVGRLLLVGGRDDALVVEATTGGVVDEIVAPPSQVRADAGAIVWPIEDGIGFRSADGVGWRATVPELQGCCSGFLRDDDTVTVLTGRGEMIGLDTDDGTVVDRRAAPSQIDAGDGRAWLYGRIALTVVPGSGGRARLHDAVDGDHLADITPEADALLASGEGTWVVLAADLALTLAPEGWPSGAQGPPIGSALVR